MFNKYFSSVFQPKSADQITFQVYCSLEIDMQILEIVLDVNEVYHCLKNLDKTKAYGLDGILPLVIKNVPQKFHVVFVDCLICH